MAADIAVLVGEERFLRVVNETVWGDIPGTPTWIDVPVSDYTVAQKEKRRNGQARTGQYQRRYGTNVSGHPAGNLVTPLFGWGVSGSSLAQLLMEWGFLDQEVKFPRSKTAQWIYKSHEDDKSHGGLRVNTATLTGSDAGISLSLELIGKTETNAAVSGVSAPNDRKRLVEFLFEDCTLALGGTEISISAFQWQVQRNLSPIYNNSVSPISLPKTSWNETFSCTPLKLDATYDALRNAGGMAEMTGTLVIKGDNAASGITNCSVAFARLSLIDSQESGGNGAIMNPLTFDVLKPDTSAAGSVMTWSTI